MSSGTTDLSNRVIVITGATSGIGFEAARVLARDRATLALVSRDRARSDEVVRTLREESGNPQIEGHIADLSILADVRRVCGVLLERYPRIHVLVNNAGAIYFRREETSEGIERTWALNVLSPFLLTHILLDRLKECAPARVVNVASSAHVRGILDLGDPEGRRKYSGFAAYSQSKLACVMWTYELARRLAGTGVTANALHPGFVATRWGRNNAGAPGVGLRIAMALFAISPEKGARTTVHLAASPKVAGVTGQYFTRSRAVRSSGRSYDIEKGRALWTVLCDRAGVAPDAPSVGRATQATSSRT
jgi:NAD(P)-dependent dehydrogenase (short-subunit alcohol dehydrogenase family)